MILKKIILAGIVFFFFACADPIEQASQKAFEAYASGDIEGAIALNKKVLDLDSTGISSVTTYYNLSVLYKEKGDIDSSKSSLQKILSIAPEELNAKLDLSRLLLEEEKYDDVISMLNTLKEKGIENAMAFATLASAYRFKEDVANCINYANLCISLDSNYAEAYYNLAIIAELQGLLEDAIPYYEKALDLDSNYNAIYPVLSNLYGSMGKREQAVDYGQKALVLFPKDNNIINNMGFIYLELDELDLALEMFQKVISNDSTHAFAYNNIGHILLKQNKVDDAIEYILKSLQLDMDNAYAHRNLALAYIQRKEKTKACLAIEKAMLSKFRLRLMEELQALQSSSC